ncbi:hypothetical protein HYALB_00008033 [Hymenoscyphus albidus]|uniref:WSC domain-containing protein n=1 Tax=Hymenoscyphus albidus TaxID=595503 RepID=A0A9N9LJR1_9HELO|nr:hypothetical protein HYALB_00008033 [Hymenoscyphus albidus]
MAPSLFQVAVALMFVGAAVSSSDNGYGHGGGLFKRIAAAMPHTRDVALTPAVVPASLPGSWTYQGCYTDNGPRTLIGKATSSGTLMTDEYCIAFCDQNGYLYAGTEYSNECYCGNVIGSISAVAPSSECSMGCSGNNTEACGGPGRLTVFWNGEDPPPGPSTNPGAAEKEREVVLFLTAMLYQEETPKLQSPFALPRATQRGILTLAWNIITNAEQGCDNSIKNAATVAPGGLSDCNSLCAGNSSEYCGSNDRLNIYKQGYIGSQSTVSSVVASSTRTLSTSASSVVSSISVVSSSSAVPTTSSSQLPSSSSSSSVLSLNLQLPTTSSSSSLNPVTSSSSSTATSPTSSSTKVLSSSFSSPALSPTASSSPSSSQASTSSATLSSSSSAISGSSSASSSSSKNPTSSVTISESSSSSVKPSSSSSSSELLSSSSKAPSSSLTIDISSSSSAVINVGSSSSLVPTSSSIILTSSLSSSASTSKRNSASVSSSSSVLTSSPVSSSAISPSSSSSSSSGSPSVSTSSSAIASSLSSSSSLISSAVLVPTSSIIASSSSTSASPTPTPTVLRVVPSAGPFNYFGCYTEANNGRALTPGAFPADTLTVESCATSCASYDYFGVEYGHECYCGNKLATSSTKAPETDCSFTCGNRLNVYIKNGTVPPPSSTAPGPGTTPTPPTTPPTQATGLPTGWQYDGCYTEGTTGRALTTMVFESGTNSVESCVNTCIAQGYTVAGMEYSSQWLTVMSLECFCDNVLYNGAAPTDDSKCQMSCSGNAAEKCGAPGALSLYHTGALKAYAAPTAQKTGLPGSWVYQGCWSDNMDGRALLWQSILTTNNTATSCLNLCHDYGYMAAGLQYGDECMCGDHQKAIDAGSTQQPETDCQVPCSGDRTYYCGGGSRNSYYRWIGDDIYTWHKPTGPDAGSYEFLIGGVVVPLITTAGINKKVTFMEKSGTGAPNTTGTYELDLSLKNDFSKAWRPLHVKSDIFCSAGVTLPDKAGRQLNIGGWAGPSTYGVRFYWPDGSPGVAGTNDWQENVNEVSLKEGRWYPSAMNMANGSILILGGEVGSNAAPTPSCEILPPPPGGYAKYLDWLDRTDPDNLYPFMFVLPTGNIFVVYYNEARIIDEKTFDTIKTLPNMPGSVNNFLSGRTYPLEGTGVLLPMHAPFTAPVVVLICGGSANGAAYAVDNCVSTQPEDATPTWNLERMPSQRVMSCICALPDGTYLILNGAQEGVAGFGLAQDPNYNAILYDPSKPLNQRMFIMASTIVARLYHSEAMLLPDGRVLVSGSNPEDGVHPEEYRVEVFNPPYILNNLPKPSYTITTTNKDWSYGSTRQITANIPSGNLAGVRVSMMAAVSSTHGNSMGQRTLSLQVGCAGAANAATCTITTPPTAHVAPPGWYMIFVLDGPTPSEAEWVRIGGDVADAAGIGNWPAAADFKTPGLGPIGS